ncbi:MAG: sugar phosphate nucleotidyltransferase [Patescibacteria group bacterium]
MGYIQDAKKLCIERDANKCRHCGTSQNLFVHQLTKRKGRLAWNLSNLITTCGRCSELSEISRKNIHNKNAGVLLCGGRATRLFPLTKFHNKHELPIGIVPMIFYPLKTLRAFGVYRVLAIVDRDGAKDIINMLGSGKEWGLDISYKIQEGSGGISEALYLAKDFVRPDDTIVTILGDNIFDYEQIDKGLDMGDNKACIFTKKVNNPEDYGVAVMSSDGKVTEVIEKPKEHIGDMAVVGLYLYTNDVFGVIDKIKPSDRGELEISAVNNHYAKNNSLINKSVEGYWADCGSSIQRYCEAALHGAKIAKVSKDEIENFVSIIFDEK